jgi:hypothetical protein
VAQQFFAEERVAVRATPDVAQDVLGHRAFGRERVAQQLRHLALVERLQLHERRRAVAQDAAQQRERRMAGNDLVVAVGADEEHPLVDGPLGEHEQQLHDVGVGPVQVFEDDDRGRTRGQPFEGVDQRRHLLVLRSERMRGDAAGRVRVERPEDLQPRAEGSLRELAASAPADAGGPPR